MLKISKQTLIAAVVIAAASAPANAIARPDYEPPLAAARSAAVKPTQLHRAKPSAYERAVAKRIERTPGALAGPTTQPQRAAHDAAASPSSSFQWDDAGIGAAGMLGLLGAAVASPSSYDAAATTRHPPSETTERAATNYPVPYPRPRERSRAVNGRPLGRPFDAADLSSLA